MTTRKSWSKGRYRYATHHDAIIVPILYENERYERYIIALFIKVNTQKIITISLREHISIDFTYR